MSSTRLRKRSAADPETGRALPLGQRLPKAGPRCLALCLVLALCLGAVSPGACIEVLREGARTILVDRTGERWDITQAVRSGFDPHGFGHGLGDEAFTSLDDTALTRPGDGVRSDLRVLGTAVCGEAVAISLRRLARHEVANLTLGGQAVAVAY